MTAITARRWTDRRGSRVRIARIILSAAVASTAFRKMSALRIVVGSPPSVGTSPSASGSPGPYLHPDGRNNLAGANGSDCAGYCAGFRTPGCGDYSGALTAGRQKSAKAGNRGRLSNGGAACAMGILRRALACGGWTGAVLAMGLGQSMVARVGVTEWPAR